MTNIQQWKKQFAKDYTTKVFEGASLEENTRNSLAYFTDFIETQIDQAEKRGEKRMKKKVENLIENTDDYQLFVWDFEKL